MKKALLSIVFCVLAIYGFGQAKVEIGLKAGLNFANISTEEASGISYNSRTGFHGGAYGLIKVANIGIQPEVFYSTQGSTIDIDGLSDDLTSDLVYLNIPVMLKLYMVAGLNLQVGPQFGLLVSAEQDDFDMNGNVSGTQDIKDELKGSDISAAFGAGWDAPFGLSFTARYVLGLNDINDDPDVDDASKNRMFQVSVGYRLFKIGN